MTPSRITLFQEVKTLFSCYFKVFLFYFFGKKNTIVVHVTYLFSRYYSNKEYLTTTAVSEKVILSRIPFLTLFSVMTLFKFHPAQTQ